ncbi:MAG: LarC family nickel insertion protein [Candidatus Micrarchaeota archaeon]
MRILFLDCFSGIAGDMFLGAMVDAGLEFQELKEELEKLNLSGYKLLERKVDKKGIKSTKIDVLLENKHPHGHRKYADIVQLIQKSSLSEKIKHDALGIFHILAEAEAKVHGKLISEVEFHEVGGIDSIVDIAGAAIAIEKMGISEAYCSKLNVGFGKRVFHGKEFEVPAPATREILKGIPTYSAGEGEKVTPTGASIVKYFCKKPDKPEFRIISEGYGAGDLDFEGPNVLHVIYGEK